MEDTPTHIEDSIPQKPKRGRPKKTIDTPVNTHNIPNTPDIDNFLNKKQRGRPKKGTYKQPVSDIPKKSKGRPRLFLTEEEKHAKKIKNKEQSTIWKKNNPEKHNKLSSDCIKRAGASMNILKDLLANNLIPDLYLQRVNELLKRKKTVQT